MGGMSDPEMVAFTGGARVNQVGPVQDVVFFFDCIRRFAGEALGPHGRDLLLDRLYRRYLRLEELEPALAAIKLVEERFRAVPMEFIELPSPTRVDTGHANLAEALEDTCRRLKECVGSADYGARNTTWAYEPVKIVRSDFASIARESKRPPEEYDTLDGPPFWLATPPETPPSPSFKDGKQVPHGTPGSVRPDYWSAEDNAATFEAKFEE